MILIGILTSADYDPVRYLYVISCCFDNFEYK